MDCRYTGVECRRRVAVEELRLGGSYGVHSWIEGASGDGRRVSWFAPQNQGGGWRLKTPSHGGTGVGLGTDGGDGRQAASRAVRRPRRERRLGPRRGGGNLPAREVFAVFSKPATYPVSRTLQNRGLDLHQDGSIAEKTSFRRKNLGRRMRSCTGGAAGQPV